jgi:hypothetical protein
MEEALKLAATQLFTTKQYGECFKTMLALGQLTTDYRSRHNELVAKYYKYGTTLQAADSLLYGLSKLLDEQQKKLEEEFQVNSFDSETLTTNGDEKDHLKQLNQLTSTANYNCAVVNFHMQNYYKASEILSKLYTTCSDQFEESLNLKVAVLLINSYLKLNFVDKKAILHSLEVIEKNEKNGMLMKNFTLLLSLSLSLSLSLPSTLPLSYFFPILNTNII